jgi:hypothetical protein
MSKNPLWRRVLSTFYEPAALGDELAAEPRWLGALVLGAVLTVASSLLIPAEVWQTMMREQLMASGQEMPPGVEEMGANIFRIWAVVGGSIFWAIWTFLVAGVATVAFAFVLGDEGRYRQYLAATSHALVIVAVGALLLVPLRIAQSDPQLTLNVGTFFGAPDSGYVARLLSSVDLFMLWSMVVLAIAATRIDTRRSFGSAAAVLFAFVFVVLALLALIPR